MSRFDYWAVLFVASVRNIFTHKLKSSVVGLLMLFGTFLVVTGTAMLDTIEDTMSKSITSSLAGHLQAYAAGAKDELALFGGMMMGREDIGRIPDFESLRKVAEKVDNVAAVVPMGIDIASVTGGNEIDRVADAMRATLAGDGGELEALRGQLLAIVKLLRTELSAKLTIAANPEEVEEQIGYIDRLESDDFWTALKNEPEMNLQFIETKIAPMSTDGMLIYLRYVGTDLEKFEANFERFEIVKGQRVPPKQRGFLFADRFYENQIKHKVARDFDKVHRMVTEEGKAIATDELLQSLVKQNARQHRRITFQLNPSDAARLKDSLRKMLPNTRGKDGADPDLGELLGAFLTVNDENLEARHAYFYEVIAPMIELYKVGVGDVMTIRAYTRSGYLKAINVKVYGTFNFRGLEKSDLAAAANLIDMITFRDLYGLMSDARRDELESIKAQAGVGDLDADTAEADLFGESDTLVEPATEEGFDEFQVADLGPSEARFENLVNQVFDEAAINNGVALNAAVVLDDPTEIEATRVELEKSFEAAGMNIKVVNWQTASGIVGQFITVIRLVLYIAIVIIFLVALVIINNTMVMATMERTTEIGTLRAIGAQRGTVMMMFLVETVVLGILAGGLGAVVAMLFVTWLGMFGIPAGSQDVLIFLFGGPRLYPAFGVFNVVTGFVAILVVSLVSTLYPARLATRIQPVVAMQGKE